MIGKTLTIKLANECTIYEVAEKHQQIMEKWSNFKQPLNIDLSAITEIDSCFIQLLMSCKKTALENKVSCHLINASEEIGDKIKGLFAEELLAN
jgi:anti-anti-sigma regulatory factor